MAHGLILKLQKYTFYSIIVIVFVKKKKNNISVNACILYKTYLFILCSTVTFDKVNLFRISGMGFRIILCHISDYKTFQNTILQEIL